MWYAAMFCIAPLMLARRDRLEMWAVLMTCGIISGSLPWQQTWAFGCIEFAAGAFLLRNWGSVTRLAVNLLFVAMLAAHAGFAARGFPNYQSYLINDIALQDGLAMAQVAALGTGGVVDVVRPLVHRISRWWGGAAIPYDVAAGR